VVKGLNAIRPGIAAVSARIQSGRLCIGPGKCPNLVMEAGLYRYDPRLPNGETAIDEHNHTMDALRYLISGLDSHRLAKPAHIPISEQDRAPPKCVNPPAAALQQHPWLRHDNEALWTTL
jgi:hypothetical protein